MWQKIQDSILSIFGVIKLWSSEHKAATALTLIFGIVGTIGIIISLLAWRFPVTPPPPPLKCTLENDDPKEKMVQARTNCDKFSCDDNPKTAIGSYPNGTEVQRKNSIIVKGKRFNWIQVIILNRGNSIWVAESKVSCRE